MFRVKFLDEKIGGSEWKIVNDYNDDLVLIDYYKGAFNVNIKDYGFTGEQWLEITRHIESIIKQVDSLKS